MQGQNKVADGSVPRPPVPPAEAGLQTRPYDHWHLDLRESWEIDFWMKQLGCDEQALREAVFAVGAQAGAVRVYLASHPGQPHQ